MLLTGYAPAEENGHQAGRALLETLYRQATGEAMPPVCIGKRGKPYFENSPWHFSITHTKHHVFCALADRPVGIDAEETDRNINLKLADKILSPGERERFDRAPDKGAALLRLWVLKEAAGKLTGEGINGYPVHTDFSPDDLRITIEHGCFLAVITEE